MNIEQKLDIRRNHDRNGRCTNATLKYIVSYSGNLDNSEEAFDLVRRTAPEYVGTARRNSIALTRVPGNGSCEFEVNYSASGKNETQKGDERQWSFEVKTAKYHVSGARELVRVYDGNDKGSPPDPGTVIGWDGRIDGESDVSGAEILIPEMYEYCTATYRASKINCAFRRKLFDLAGKVNTSTFRGWAPGEVLLTRAEQGEPYKNLRGTELVDVTYTFAIRPSAEVNCAGTLITPVSPWNIVWSISRRNAVNNSLEVSGIYESRVYDAGNFSALNL